MTLQPRPLSACISIIISADYTIFSDPFFCNPESKVTAVPIFCSSFEYRFDATLLSCDK